MQSNMFIDEFNVNDANVFNKNLNEAIEITKVWTEEEDALLLKTVKHEISQKNWKKISERIKTKSAQQCSYRYNKLISMLSKTKWSRTDDIRLVELIENYGENWERIHAFFPGKNITDIQERFYKCLDPRLKRSKFEKEEDDMIIKLHGKFGNKWEEIAKYFPDRNATMIKNRFYSYIRKNYKAQLETAKSTTSCNNDTYSENKSTVSISSLVKSKSTTNPPTLSLPSTNPNNNNKLDIFTQIDSISLADNNNSSKNLLFINNNIETKSNLQNIYKDSDLIVGKLFFKD